MSSGTASYRCSMSSSADLSEEEDLSQKSGTGSPAPGDTLPWNLPKHERSKRKIHGGSVLDPAERAVLRIAGPSPKVACAGLLWQEMPHVEQNKSKLLFKRTKNISPRDFLWDVLSHPLHRIAEQ